MRRFTRWFALVGILAAGQRAQGQEQYADGALRGPRFLLLASETRTVPVDIKRTPILRRQLSLDLDGKSVQDAIAIISNKAGLDIAFDPSVLPSDAVVHLKADDITVAAALTDVLADAPVDVVFSRDGRATIVKRGAASPVLQTGTISGRITDAQTGLPLIGATAHLTGTSFGARTVGDSGVYRILNVPPGTYTVVARMLGYAATTQTVTVKADEETRADVALTVLAVKLNEIVSIGYGTAQRRDLTGSIASVSSDEIESAPAQSIDQALVGRAAGVDVVTSSGQPGSSAMVRIRGGNSITAGNDPLYVIDGVPVLSSPNDANTNTLEVQGVSGMNPLDDLNPQDIQSIDVLKDASATSIYGARAANGVILITTKRGKSGHPSVNIGAYYGSATVRNKLSLLDAQQFATVANLARTNAGQAPLYTPAQVQAFGTGTNWENAIFRTAPVSNLDASVSGGNTNTRYFVSGNIMQQYGVILGTDLTRGSVRLNLDQNLSDRFRLGNSLTLSRSQADVMPNGGNGQEVSSVLLDAEQANPTLPIYNSDGTFNLQTDPANGRLLANPVAAARQITNQETQQRVVGNTYAEWDLVKGLTLRDALGVDFLNSLQDFYSPSTTFPGLLYQGQGSRGELQTTTWLNEVTLHYQTHLGDMNKIDLLGGQTIQETDADNISGQGQGFVTDELGANGLNSAAVYTGIWSGNPHSSLLSYFGRMNWSIMDRYLFTATARADGSSKFGPGNQYGYFPSGAIAWRASQEPFLKNLNIFDDLKFRVSYGVTGNQDIGNYNALGTLNPSTYLLGGTKVNAYAPSVLPNPDLKWESTKQFDAGVDVAVIHNRLSVTADYYNKKTDDLLLQVTVPALTGVTSQLQNVGSVSNIGFELGVNTVNLAGRFGWTSSLNIAWNRNKVLSLGGDSIIINPQNVNTQTGQVIGIGNGANQNPTVLKVGQPINSWYGYVYNGMQNGQPTYKDLYHLGSVTSADQTIIGNAQPDYTGGFTNRFTYGPFGLTVFLQFSVGGHIYNINKSLLTVNAGTANQLTDVLHGGTDGVPEAMVGNTFDSRPSTLFVEDGTYLRGKNIRFDYELPSALLRYMRLGNSIHVQVYVSAQNLFTVTKYSGFDPEVTEYATSAIAQGIDFGTYPQTRQFTFGFNTGF
jgi:TonB-dependent starch-binding outer membrane protein SusC